MIRVGDVGRTNTRLVFVARTNEHCDIVVYDRLRSWEHVYLACTRHDARQDGAAWRHPLRGVARCVRGATKGGMVVLFWISWQAKNCRGWSVFMTVSL
jgi:hypothetical protein